MSFGSSYDAKQEVKQATDIVELVGQYIALRREGSGFTGLCPWHNDRRPSLKVSPQRQSYRCFVCGEGGDCFSFVMKIEGVSFPEALQMLAERAGISLSPRRQASGSATAANQAASPRKRIYEALSWAEEQYHRYLIESAEAEPARRYLADRGISTESIGHFRLGMAPNQWNWLTRQQPPRSVTPEILQQSGLIGTASETGRPFDRFKGRLLFAIRDAQGRTVGFGGRLVPGIELKSPAKYVNSPETPLFVKNRLLYALDIARQAIRRTETAVVVEGYTDVIMAHQHGFANTVAVLGTALGSEHIRLLRRFQANRIVLVLDGDEAGQRRADQLLELFLDSDVDLRIVTLPEGLDPCDFLTTRGSQAFAHLLDEAVDALEHRFRTASRNLDPDDTHAASQAAERVLSTLAKVRSAGNPAALRIREDQILFRLSRRTGISHDRLRERLTSLRRQPASSAQSAPRSDVPTTQTVAAQRIRPRERELIEALLLEPEAISLVAEQIRPEQIENPACRQIYAKACEFARTSVPVSLERLLLEFDEPSIKRLLVELDEHAQAKLETVEPAQRVDAVLELFRRHDLQNQRRQAIEALKQQQLEEEEELQLLDRLIRSERSRQRISGPTDG